MSERPPAASPVVALLTASAVWDARLGALLGDLSLTTRKYGLLAHIHGSPGISFSELARRSQITVQTAHTAVRGLVADGLVRDATSHAGAASALRVTPAGVDALAAAQERLDDLDAAFRGHSPELASALEQPHDDYELS